MLQNKHYHNCLQPPVVISTIKDLTENENNKKKTDEKDYEINENSKNLDGKKRKMKKKYVKEGKEESA